MRTDLVVETSTRWKYQIRPPEDRTPRRRRSHSEFDAFFFCFFFFAFVALLKNQQHPTYGLGKVRTTGGSDNTTRRTEENHRTGEMGGEWVRAAGWGGVEYGPLQLWEDGPMRGELFS